MKIKNRFDLAIENEIKTYLQSQDFNGNAELNFISPAMRRQRMKSDIEEILQMADFEEHARNALKMIKLEGKKYLEDYLSVINDFVQAAEILNSLDLEQSFTQNYNEILKISDATLKDLAQMASLKFDENQYRDSLSLFTFLTLLMPINAEYWLRAGIAAQNLDNETLALRNYEVSIQIDPQLIPAYLFASECYLKQGVIEEAINKRDTAKEVLSNIPDRNSWDDFLTSIDNLIKNFK